MSNRERFEIVDKLGCAKYLRPFSRFFPGRKVYMSEEESLEFYGNDITLTPKGRKMLYMLGEAFDGRDHVSFREVSDLIGEEGVEHSMLAIVYGGGQEMMEHLGFKANYITGKDGVKRGFAKNTDEQK